MLIALLACSGPTETEETAEPEVPWTYHGSEPDEALGALLDLDIHPIPPNPKKGEPAHEHFDVRVALRAGSWEFAAGSDAQDARWVALGEVDDIATDESVRRALRKLRAAL